MIARRSQMSAMAPAGIDSSMIGSALAPCTSATMSEECASEVMSHAAATVWISVPMLEARLAIQMEPKTPVRSGASTASSHAPAGRTESFMGALCRDGAGRASGGPSGGARSGQQVGQRLAGQGLAEADAQGV